MHCAFLKEYGSPAEIAGELLAGKVAADPFHCSLCGLCTSACKDGLDPMEMLFAMRRQAVRRDAVDLDVYKKILGYEKHGGSGLFSFYGLPEGGKTVFFPGCTLPGTRPWVVEGLLEMLRGVEPDMGIALHCCYKPSYDLGRQAFFEEHFGRLRARLLEAGVDKVLTSCPNCFKVFQRYGGPLKVETVWRFLHEKAESLPTATGQSETLLLHDPCPMRREEEEQKAMAELLTRTGHSVERLRRSGRKTFCCGEGGSVPFVRPEFAQAWGDKHKKLLGDRRVVTSCAGCANMLGRAGCRAMHVGDVLTAPETLHGTGRLPARAPWTYLHRLRLKHRLTLRLKKSA